MTTIKKTADSALAALQDDDHATAAEIVTKLKGSELKDIGARTGFHMQYQETVTAYRARLISVLPELTASRRAEVAAQRELMNEIYLLARDYDESVEHAMFARKNGLPETSTAFMWVRSSVEANTIDEALPKLVDKLRSLRSREHFDVAAPMARAARPGIFDALHQLDCDDPN